MNIKCLICSDLFTAYADIYTTPCGHLFHYLCLTQWIERSRTCPQCRSRTTEKSIHKIFLSVDEHNENLNDIGTVQNKLDNIQFQLKLKEIDVKNATEKYETAKAQNVGLREEIKDQDNKVRVLESAMHALKEQTTYFKLKAKENARMEEEIVKLKEKINEMERVQLVISGSREQVNDMLRHNRDPQSLSLLVSTLKQELIQSDRKRQQIKNMLKEKQTEYQNSRRELAQVNKQHLMLQQETEIHKNCETERQYLKKKIEQLQNTIAETQSESKLNTSICNTSINRILTESPAPFPKKCITKTDNDKNDSLSLPEKVQEIKNSDSPYLRVQFSTVGLSGLMKYNNKSQLKQSNGKFSLFKRTCAQSDAKGKQPSSEMSYDGLGGHSKYEEFPSPHVNTGIKRPKSMSNISIKFKKLAPAPQKKVNEYFVDSQD